MESARVGFVEGTRGRIWYKVLNPGAPGVPALCVHGGPGFVSMTDGVELLADERSVVLYDQLGCGRSFRPADLSLCSPEYYYREIAAVRSALGLGRVHLLAQSWGALVVLSHVLAGAQGILSLTLSGPLVSTPQWAADQRKNLAKMPEALRETIRSCEESGDFGSAYQEAMMAYYARHICRLSPWPDALLDAFGKMNTDLYFRLWGRSEFTVTGVLKDADLSPRLGEVTVPTLLTCGEWDEALPSTLLAYRDALPKGSLAVLPGASHMHMVEKPALYAEIVREHLKEAEEVAGVRG
jgi:proline iminopeptidase